MKLQHFLLVFLFVKEMKFQKNNVCKNYIDYVLPGIETNPNCWYNPDVFSTPEEVSRNHGFQFQNHSVLTEDGYRITLFRIQDHFTNEKKQPVYLHHGLFSNAMCFMTSGNRSLAFYLARNGYDVWLGNHRGTNYSPGHSRLKLSDKKFWDFSFHEIGLYDIPAALEHISGTIENFEKIIYVGHSMGTTSCFIYASIRSTHAKNFLKGFIALSPVTTISHSSKVPRFVVPYIGQILENLLKMNINVLFPFPKQMSKFLISTCQQHPIFCLVNVNLVIGEEEGQLLPEDVIVGLSYFPSRTATKILLHYAQVIFSGRFQQFNYKEQENLLRYNASTPPVYPLQNIEIPVHMLYGMNDHLSSYEDVLGIYKELKNADKSINLVPNNPRVRFNHIDFLYAKDAEIYLHKPMVRIMKGLK